MTYEILNYFDVWGNEEDGFEVNDQCIAGQIEILNNTTNQDLIEIMQNLGLLTARANLNTIEIDDQCGRIEISDKKTGMPLFGLSEINN